MDLVIHIVLFLILALGICIMGAFYTEPDDEPALRSLPKRYLTFVGACGAVAVVMLIAESIFASV